MVRRFGESETPTLLASVAHALMNRGAALGALNRPQDALEAWNEVVPPLRGERFPCIQCRGHGGTAQASGH